MAKVSNGVEKLPKISTGWVGCTSVSDDRRTGDIIQRTSKILKLLSRKWQSHLHCEYRTAATRKTVRVNSALHPSGVAKSSTSFGWNKGWNVTSAGRQVTLCDPIWHVSSCSGEACCELLYPVTLLYYSGCNAWPRVTSVGVRLDPIAVLYSSCPRAVVPSTGRGTPSYAVATFEPLRPFT